MGASAQDRAGDGQAAGDGGAQGGGEGARAAKFVVTETWVPGSSRRVLPDGSVVRWVTNEGVLLDYAIRLRGALDEIKRVAESEHRADEPFDPTAILKRWGV